jgi:hypothetical protein
LNIYKNKINSKGITNNRNLLMEAIGVLKPLSYDFTSFAFLGWDEEICL